MTHTASPPGRFNVSDAVSALMGLFAQLGIGILLVLFAGVLAVMTAFAGVLLAAAALVMRFANRKPGRTASPAGDSDPLTLDARRTPRGWTVE